MNFDITKILFMMPHWEVVSEVWIQRMIKALGEDVSLIASHGPQTVWKGEVDGFELIQNCFPKKSISHRLFKWYSSIYARRKNYRALRQQIQKKKIDTIFINYASFALKTKKIWEETGTKIFVHVHGYDIHFEGRKESPPYKRLWPNSYKDEIVALSKEKNVNFIANSQFTQQHLIDSGIAADKVFLKYFGVATQDFDSIQQKRQSYEGPTRLLYVGRLIDFKGPNVVLKYFEDLRNNGVEAQLTIAGDGYLFDECLDLKNKSKFADDIKLLGAVKYDEVKELYINSDVFLNHHQLGPQTNREEAFGVTMIEAMSFGLPILTCPSGGVAESVVDNETGFLVKNAEEYLSKLQELCENHEHRVEMGKSAKLHATKNFSIEQELTQMGKIFQGS